MNKYIPSPLWVPPPQNWQQILDDFQDRTLSGLHSPAKVYFRADDIGLPSKKFSKMLEIFERWQMPLALAAVPTWLPLHFEKLERIIDLKSPLWCLHMHGFRHMNHEPSGKKCEFGSARTFEAILRDIKKGHDLLEKYLGTNFVPLFTPPWNRCNQETLDALVAMGFLGLSRTEGALPPAPKNLWEIPVHVDLHTRKEPDPSKSLQALLHELDTALRSGVCGIMLHHQRMNGAAFSFLERLLEALSSSNKIRAVSLRLERY